MSAVRFDFSAYPIVKVHYEQELTAMEAHLRFNDLEESLEKLKGPFVLINFTSGKLLSPDTQVALGERTAEFIRRFDGRYRGSALVVKSAIARMMVKGTLQLVRNTSMIKIVDSEAAAIKLAKAWLEG